MMTSVVLLLLLACVCLIQVTYQEQAQDMKRMTISGQISDHQREAILIIIQKLRDQVEYNNK